MRIVFVCVLMLAGCGGSPKPEVVVDVEQKAVDQRTPDQIAAQTAITQFDEREHATEIRRSVDEMDSQFKVEERIKETKRLLEQHAKGTDVAESADDLSFELNLLQAKRIRMEDDRARRLKEIEEIRSKRNSE